ncbi:MAG: hypothetical protein LBT01_08720 [Spirochaetaceae bacterium]|jgi:hypothetical protein|nr:hypothetical protein [Spirochaetaceae bacterium]
MKDLFTALAPSYLADTIDTLLATKKTTDEYKSFIANIFNDVLGVAEDDPVWKLFAALDAESDYWTAPASTRYHGSHECGLVRHSLAVLSKAIRLYPVMVGGAPDMYHLVVSCLFHDLCKVNMYERKSRNVKNEKTGAWEAVPCYFVRADYISFGHGIESMLRLNRFIKMPVQWNHAIRWHMGAYDLSESDAPSHKKALGLYKEVLLLHSADMQAALVDA